jgi:membrane protein implicated in regulation of membrane protease activity
LYAEFIEWAKFLILGIGGIFLAVLMWQVEGLMGKTIVIVILVFIVAGALVKTCSKYLDDKIKRQKEKETVSERVGERIDRLNDNLGRIAIRFQRYFYDFKEGDTE